MSEPHRTGEIRMIPVDRIDLLNPRARNKQKFEEIVGNIKTIGLKKPITVTPRSGENGERFMLICGEGRLKAYRSLGAEEIPAMVIQVDDEEAFIMSLAENIARRQHQPLELLAGIGRLVEQGYSKHDIASKIGLTAEYVGGILNLIENGEERLMAAVEVGRIPLNAALDIARAGVDEQNVQAALQEAYESGKLRGKQLVQARRVMESRQRFGKAGSRHILKKSSEISTSSLIRNYQREVDRQKLLVKKAHVTQQRLMFIVGALRSMLADENFTNLLRAEGLDTLPKYLADRVWSGERSA